MLLKINSRVVKNKKLRIFIAISNIKTYRHIDEA